VRPKVNFLLMDSIPKKILKVNDNLYFNLIRPAEKGPRLVLENMNEWRVVFTILELLRRRGYNVDRYGFINTSFKEIHTIFSESTSMNIIKRDTAAAFEALAARSFDLTVKDKDGERVKKDSRLLAWGGDLTTADKIQINEIFYHNIHSNYIPLRLNPIGELTRAARKLQARGRLFGSDILMYLYTLQGKRAATPAVRKHIPEAAKAFDLSARLYERHGDRVREALERGAGICKNMRVISGFYFKHNDIFFTFKEKEKSRERA